MPRGQPDYGIMTQTSVASGISDPGEAAARLGSINVYDRRGWTAWMDNFEAPNLKWDTASSVGGVLPTLSTIRAPMGIQSVRLHTAGLGGEWAQIAKGFPLLRLGKVGIEFWIYLVSFAPNYMRVRLNIGDGVDISQAELRLDFATTTATIVTPTGNIPVSTNCFNTPVNEVFVPIKLVVDMDTDRYVRLLIGPDEIDLSAHALVDGGATTDRFLNVSMRLLGSFLTQGVAYVDNFILTQNEP